MHVPLHDGWTVHAVGPGPVGEPIPATVPGCAHLDLMAAGVIADPYLDTNERDVGWIGRTDWRYETTISWPVDGADDPGRIDLVALGLDTVATIALNGAVLARTANMHRSWRFPIEALLRPGANRLAVTFAAGLTAAEQASTAMGSHPHVNAHPFNALRKMASNFGWDWGPDLVTAGIWRAISIHAWDTARIASVRPLVDIDGTTGVLRAHVAVERAPGADGPLAIGVEIDGLRGGVMLGADESAGIAEIKVADVRRWQPRGYGDQALYDVTVTVGDAADGNGDAIDTWHGRVGFRTTEIDTSIDERGRAFSLVINGQRVFARGVNWVPGDAFPSRVTRERYASLLNQACAANVNVIRVWGGGIYESEEFYQVCDELGLLVWQDFAFACAAYTEDEPLRGEVIAEAREAVTRLSAHPSLVLWNGGNENIWGYEDWDWKAPLAGRSWGLGYYTRTLPDIVADLDPTRPYTPGSPYSFTPDRHPNDPAYGTMHIWDVWNDRDYTAYRDYAPRFVAEFGFQAPPSWATLTRAIHDEPLSPTSAGMLAHQKAEDGNGKLDRGLHGHLPAPENFADWHWATSLNQARAVAYGIEHFRSIMPHCMGALVWQLNDVWPVTSWAAIDGDGRPKPLWYALRRVFADRLLTVQPRDGALAVIAVNDSGERWRDQVEVARYTVDGAVLARVCLEIDVPARDVETRILPGTLSGAGDPRSEVLVARASGTRPAWWQYAEDVDAHLPAPDFDAVAEAIDGGVRVVVRARTYLRDLSILADRVTADARVDDMLITLLPDESATFMITGAAGAAPDAFTDPLVLRSANQLVAVSKGT